MAKKKASRSKHLEAPRGGLILRMYRQGLGDCFLLAIGAARGTRYVLIDCGVHSRQNSGPDRLGQVMEDLVEATGGRLDVIVTTHEHADHLSGFVQKGSPFLENKIKVGQLWVGWTEKVGDEQADRLRRKRGTARSVIEKTLDEILPLGGQVFLEARIRRHSDFERFPDDSLDEESIEAAIRDLTLKQPDQERAKANVAGLLSAADGIGGSMGLGAAGGRRKKPSKNELALALLAALAEEVVFGEAGDVWDVPGVDGLRAYVLGPPRDEKLLKKDQPSKIRKSSRDDTSDEHDGGEYKEVYLSGGSGARAYMYAPALSEKLPFDVAAGFPDDMRHPFRWSFRRKIKNLKKPTARLEPCGEFRDEIRRIETLLEETYCSAGADWRQIGADWLAPAEHLALNLDSDTNNTSLVLAFEWGEPGKGQVLLFPGDAQVGNWLSWRRQSYRAGGVTATADELLDRVVLYKVGHHASHNATGRRDSSEVTDEHPLGVPFGLELMDDIIAMIPVDRTAARKNRPWEMPHTPLYRRLRDKARRRVLRCDSSLEPLKTPPDGRDLTPASGRWSKAPGLKNVRWREARKQFAEAPELPLYYDVEFKPGR